MKILYLHQHFKFPSEAGSSRPYYLAKCLAEQGHEVHVLCGGDEASSEEIHGYFVRRFQVPYSNKMGSLKRGRSFLQFNRKAYSWAKRKEFDLCYASSTPLTVGILARKLKRTKKIPFIFEVRDLWPRAPIELKAIKLKSIKRGLYRLERKIYQTAEHVVTLSPAMLNDIKSRFPNINCTLISNFSDPNLFKLNNNINENTSINSINIIYFGAIGITNGLVSLITLGAALQEKDIPHRIAIYGEGSEKKKLQELVSKQNLSGINIYDAIGKSIMPDKLNFANFSYISFADIPVLTTNSPNKLFDSLAAGLIPIVNVKGWMKELLEKNNFGVYHDPTNTRAAVDQLSSYLGSSKKLIEERKISSEVFNQFYTYQTAERKLLDLIIAIEKEIPA